ncbi:hypothetical protein PT2222_90024 [Paraburkholderia tropica]
MRRSSNPQDHLRDDVLLDFVRPAVNRRLAIVEVVRRERGRVVVAACCVRVLAFEERRIERRGQRTDRIDHQLGERLLDFGALDLQHRRFGTGTATVAGARDHALGGDFERHQFDFDGGHARGEHRIEQQRLAVLLLVQRDGLEEREFAVRRAHARDARALMAEQIFRVSPAAILLADEVLDRHLHVLEEHFVDLMVFVERDDRTHGNARRLHVDQQERNAFLLLRGGVGAHEAEHHVGVLAERGPGLLAIHDVMVARRVLDTNGARAQRSEIGTGTGFGIALTPPVFARADARQIAALLRFVAVLHDDGRDHRHAERQHRRRADAPAFRVPDMALRFGPAGAAEFDGPCGYRPALLAEQRVPAGDVVAREALVIQDFVAHGLRQIGLEPGADFGAECVVSGGVIEIHAGCLLAAAGWGRSPQPRRRPAWLLQRTLQRGRHRQRHHIDAFFDESLRILHGSDSANVARRRFVVVNAPRLLGETVAYVLRLLQDLAHHAHHLRLPLRRLLSVFALSAGRRVGRCARARQIQPGRGRQARDFVRAAHRTFDQLALALRLEVVCGSEPAFKPMAVWAL